MRFEALVAHTSRVVGTATRCVRRPRQRKPYHNSNVATRKYWLSSHRSMRESSGGIDATVGGIPDVCVTLPPSSSFATTLGRSSIQVTVVSRNEIARRIVAGLSTSAPSGACMLALSAFHECHVEVRPIHVCAAARCSERRLHQERPLRPD